ncbi:MAG: polysaccharide deacetylase family protein [Clostridia bacterium]|nr:polysaccharide deacetylase family protein [Clostridia bacterium]
MSKIYMRFPQFKEKAVTLSYDDGVRQDKKLIAIMKRNGLKGTFNLNSNMFARDYNGETRGRMSVKEAVELYLNSDMEVAVHGANHMSLTLVDELMALNDVLEDRKSLEKTFGGIIKGMAYAYGAYNDSVVDMIKKCGIKYSRVTETTEGFSLPTDWLRWAGTCHHNCPRMMELAHKFIEGPQSSHYWFNRPKLFYLWGHSYEFDNNDNWNVIEEFAEYIGGREDVWYATNGEIYEYVQACDRLEFSAEANCVYNPSCLDVYIECFGKKYLIPSGKTIYLIEK